MSMSTHLTELPDIPPLIHQAELNPHCNEETLHQQCDASRHFDFGGFCTNPPRIASARDRLGPSKKTKLIAVIAFPFGTTPRHIKKIEAEWAAEQGAEELELAPDFFALNQGQVNLFAEEIASICDLGLPVRIILDIAKLSPDTLKVAIDAAIDAGVSGLQTGNGFGPSITKNDIETIKQLTRGRCEIKAVGGIKKLNHMIELVTAGANFIGTSMGPELLRDLYHKKP